MQPRMNYLERLNVLFQGKRWTFNEPEEFQMFLLEWPDQTEGLIFKYRTQVKHGDWRRRAMMGLASHYISICVVCLYILWRIQQEAEMLSMNMFKKLCEEMLFPIFQVIWSPLLTVKTHSLNMLCTTFHWAQDCTLWLLKHLRTEVRLPLLSWAQGAYYGLVSFHQKTKGTDVIRQIILQHLFFTCLWGCLHVCREMVIQGIQAMCAHGFWFLYDSRTWWAPLSAPDSLEACPYSFSSTGIPLSQRFPGPDPSTLSWRSLDSASLSSLVVHRNVGEQTRTCSFESPGVFPTLRCQNKRTRITSPWKEALAHHLKRVCLLLLLLFLYDLMVLHGQVRK
ncbi:uncharacterized protein LOC141515422 [Macrotis lagotis]|uniref:uncharacterized protein LOC141515422 n=1 Tax=Macrotis lagotis TaxID=92651 RepID=UPI003D689C87